ncbi:MAG: thioredoxin [Chitinispirillia bacterium]
MKITLILFFFIYLSTCYSQISVNGKKGAALSDSSDISAKKIVNSEKLVLADFWAEWCRPCHILDPIIEEIKKKYRGKLNVIKINIDRNQKLAQYFRVVSIPSVFLIKDKSVVKNLMGVQPKEVYITTINEILNSEKKKDE